MRGVIFQVFFCICWCHMEEGYDLDLWDTM
jgi:hypothetical protein